MGKKESQQVWRPRAWKPLYVVGGLVTLLLFVGSCGVVLFAVARGGDFPDEPTPIPQPQNAEEFVLRGIDYADDGDITSALADFTEAIRLDPRFARAYYNRGVTYNKVDRFQEAIQDFSQAVILDPRNGAAYANRAFAYTMLGLDLQASTDVEMAVTNGVNRDNLEQQIEGARRAREQQNN